MCIAITQYPQEFLSEKDTLPKELIQKGVKAWNIRMSPPPDEPKC